MKTFLLMLIGFQFAVALEAPYLISVQATNDTGATLTWRNNNISYTNIVILRKETTTYYKAIDTVLGNVSDFHDRPLLTKTEYYYRLIALSQTEISDTSNVDSVKTITSYVKPCSSPLKILWGSSGNQIALSLVWDQNSRKVALVFDRSRNVICDEKGIIVKRALNDAPFMIRDTFNITNPFANDTLTWFDSQVDLNSWYYYKISVYSDSAGPYDVPFGYDSIFTLNTDSLFYANRQGIQASQKLSTIPFYYGTNSWIMKVGDSIFAKESNVNDSSLFSIIDISDISNPSFKGYHSSTLAIPDSARCFSFGKALFVSTFYPLTETTSYYNYRDTGFVLLDSKPLAPVVAAMDDTTFLAINQAAIIKNSGIETVFSKYVIIGNFSGHSVSIVSINNVIGKILIAKNIWSGGVGGGIEYRLYDYRLNNSSPRYIGAPDKLPPPFRGGFFLLGPAFSKAITAVIDTTAKHVFVVDSNNTLSIYKFQITNPTSVASPYKPASFNPGFSLISCKRTGLNTFFIITSGAQIINEIRLYNLRGRMISKKANRNQPTAMLDVSDAASGVYLLEVFAGGNRYTKQIAVQR